jgi:aspartate ammonia-lyase
MPGKVNPVLPELAAMVCFQVIGNDTAVAYAVQAGQLELNVMMPTMALNVLNSITWISNMLRQLDEHCIRGIQANVERCREYAQRTAGLATALNPIVGYAKAAELAKEASATGSPVVSIAVQKGILAAREAEEILDPKRMTEPQYPRHEKRSKAGD